MERKLIMKSKLIKVRIKFHNNKLKKIGVFCFLEPSLHHVIVYLIVTYVKFSMEPYTNYIYQRIIGCKPLHCLFQFKNIYSFENVNLNTMVKGINLVIWVLVI